MCAHVTIAKFQQRGIQDVQAFISNVGPELRGSAIHTNLLSLLVTELGVWRPYFEWN